MLNQDYKEMLQCLADEAVEFLIVGAYALAAHGIPRSTADFDIWVNPTSENSQRVYRALATFGAPLDSVTPADFAEEGVLFQIGVVPCRIDIITKISGDISFSTAMSQAETVDFDNVSMPILSLDNLLTNKEATGRPKDIEDVKLLKKHQSMS